MPTPVNDNVQEKPQQMPLVLVADDEYYAQMLLRRVFEREGLRVETAENGFDAINKAQTLLPDLILMDIQMPGLDGFEAVRLLREDERTQHIPIIVVTAAAREPADVARGLGLGADDYQRKPFNTSELVARARSKIRAYQLEQRLKQRSQQLETLVHIGSVLNQELALDELADRIMQAVIDPLPATTTLLVLVNEAQQPVLVRQRGWQGTLPGPRGGEHPTPPHAISNASDGKKPSRSVASHAGSGTPIPDLASADLLASDTLPGYALRTHEAEFVANKAETTTIQRIFSAGDCVSGIAVPLLHHGKILGVLALGDIEPGHFSAEHLSVLRSIAEQAALAIRNAQLYTELRGYAAGLEDMVAARTAALQAAQAQLVRAEKLAALGTLAAGVAHEVNNPLQAIQTNLEMALEDLDQSRSIDRELLDFAKQDVQRIEGIVRRLLDFARPAQPSLVNTNLNDVVKEVISLAGKQLEHSHVKVQMTLNAKRNILGSGDQLKQVILNLVVNAMEAMPGGGKLTLNTKDSGDNVILTVRDTGVGIRPEELPQVFDPFFTTKADGTGLGLSVTYSIIEGHNGQIEVKSESGTYTEFVVRLPAINKS